MATNEPLNSAADEVAAAEAELKAAQEKLEAAKAKLAATTSDDACDVEKETVAAVVVDEATGEVEAVVVEDVAVVSCDAGSEDKEEAPSDASTDASTEDASEASAAAPSAAPAEPAKAAEPEPEWVPYSTAQAIPPTAAPQATPAQPQPQAPAAASASTASYTQPAGAPPAPGQPASGYYAPPGYGAPQTPPHAGPGAVPPQQPYYGYQQPYYQQPYSQPMVTTKDHVAAGLLAIFLGAFGIHKFYLGYNTAGFIMLAVTIIGGVLTFSLASWVIWVIAIIEGILYLTKSQTEFEQIYVLNTREWFSFGSGGLPAAGTCRRCVAKQVPVEGGRHGRPRWLTAPTCERVLALRARRRSLRSCAATCELLMRPSGAWAGRFAPALFALRATGCFT